MSAWRGVYGQRRTTSACASAAYAVHVQNHWILLEFISGKIAIALIRLPNIAGCIFFNFLFRVYSEVSFSWRSSNVLVTNYHSSTFAICFYFYFYYYHYCRHKQLTTTTAVTTTTDCAGTTTITRSSSSSMNSGNGNKQETHGPRFSRLSKTAIAYLQMSCNILPVTPHFPHTRVWGCKFDLPIRRAKAILGSSFD